MSGSRIVLARLLCAVSLAALAIGFSPVAAFASGASPAAKVTPAASRVLADDPPTDSDGDGIPDDQDSCQFEPGVPENYGCPYLGPTDTDGDGVYDDQDQCQFDSGPASNYGCPVSDSDGDGLTDDVDACPYQAGPYDGCPLTDYDGDGVYDDGGDLCPNEAGPASNNGCPIPDTDHDGVTDDMDSCPDTQSGAEIDGFGCSAAQRDSDSDGLSDADDQCATTPGPADNHGCPLTKVTAPAVTFDDRCGTLNDTASVPTAAGVTYFSKGKRVPAGRYYVHGTVTVEARAAKGYELSGTSTWSKTFTSRTCRAGVVRVVSTVPGQVTVSNSEQVPLRVLVGGVSKAVKPGAALTFAVRSGYRLWAAAWTSTELSPAAGTVRVR